MFRNEVQGQREHSVTVGEQRKRERERERKAGNRKMYNRKK